MIATDQPQPAPYHFRILIKSNTNASQQAIKIVLKREIVSGDLGICYTKSNSSSELPDKICAAFL